MWLMPKMSRTWALFLMTAGGTIFFILFGLSFEYKWPVSVLVGFQIIQTLSAQGVVSILYTLSSELFPTPVRSLGLGIVSGFGRFGAVLGPFLMGLAFHWGMKISQAIYLFAAPLFIASILALLVIRTETRKRTLEDIAAGEIRSAGVGR
jgi:putative MFS transporter